MSNNNEQEFREMVSNGLQTLDVNFNGTTEAPFSFNVNVITPNGFPSQLTVRGIDGDAELFKKRINGFLEWLDSQGYEPQRNGRYIPNPPPPATAPTMPAPAGEPEWKICEVHQARMTRKGPGAGGDFWYSHKAMDPATGGEYWCKGKRRSGLVE
jgi:hypothetical protein